MLVAGQFSSVNGVNLGSEGSLVRLNADGTRDLSLRAVVHEQGTDFVNTVAIQPDGKLVVGGSFVVTVNGVALRRYLARLNADGSLNTDFPAASPFGGVQALAVRPNGKILLGGTFDSLFDTPRQSHRGIVQLNGDGSLDTGFTPNFNVGTSVEALALQPDGKVWVGGIFSSFDGRDARRIARLMPDGALDLTFGPFPVTSGWVLAVVLQPDGKPIVGGNFFGPAVGHADIARLLPQSPQMSLDRTELRFGATSNGSAFVAQTAAQNHSTDPERNRHGDVDGDVESAVAAGQPGIGDRFGKCPDQRGARWRSADERCRWRVDRLRAYGRIERTRSRRGDAHTDAPWHLRCAIRRGGHTDRQSNGSDRCRAVHGMGAR